MTLQLLQALEEIANRAEDALCDPHGTSPEEMALRAVLTEVKETAREVADNCYLLLSE